MALPDIFLYYSGMPVQARHLTIHVSHRAYCGAGWSWDSRTCPYHDYNLWLIAAGRGHARIDWKAGSREHELVPGECFVLRASEPISATHDPRHPLEVPYAVFSCREKGFDPPRHVRLTDLSFIDGLMERCIRAYHGHQPENAALWLSAALFELEQQAAHPLQTDARKTATVTAHAEAMRRDPAGRIPTAQLARALSCSEDHAIRVFRRQMGCSPREYHMRARLDEARALLIGSSLTIGEIARELGYADIYFFSRHFRARQGLSPRQYRERWRRERP